MSDTEGRRQPDASALLAALELERPPIGLYDAPDPTPFSPLAEPGGAGRGRCVFDFYERWLSGETLHLTHDRFGCPGAGRALCEAVTRDRDDFIDFLWKDEGLRAERELMAHWVDNAPVYHPEHEHVLIGPLKPAHYRFLKTVTLWVNPDQLSVLQLGAYHHHDWGDPAPVIAPFGSGCMELVAGFEDLERPQAAIGGTDVAMREQIPRDVLAFTVTVPMFERLCALDERSFLHKAFLRDLRAARSGLG
jgi:hypothetical protein